MNRFRKRIKNFCDDRAEEAIGLALDKAKKVTYESLSDSSRELLRSVARESIANGEPAPDAYKKIVQHIFGPHVSRVSSDIRVPFIIAALILNKEEWISFHSRHIDDFMQYYNTATYSVSKAYVASFVEVAKEKSKRKKAEPNKAEKSLLFSSLENDTYED